MRGRKVRVEDDATCVRPVSAPAILHTKTNPNSDGSQRFLGVLVFQGQMTYDENLALNVCVHHFRRHGCFELMVFRQTRRKGVWCQFYLKERPILDQIEPRKLKMLSQQKIREKVSVSTTAGPTKVTCQQALVLARYCLVRDIIQQHLGDIINYEISIHPGIFRSYSVGSVWSTCSGTRLLLQRDQFAHGEASFFGNINRISR